MKVEQIREQQDKDLLAYRKEATENLLVMIHRHWNHVIMIKDELYERGWIIRHNDDGNPVLQEPIF